ncbi:MAG: hypothetical protein NKF70_01390 [Methanobacterium sp. ERen5]|nr:MAG: hypothetical protein NKF70_01390 [Methanobacterium sp. ERen5]
MGRGIFYPESKNMGEKTFLKDVMNMNSEKLALNDLSNDNEKLNQWIPKMLFSKYW